ncbi:MAG: methyltransferase domain-containing protein [Candidatus Latescibacteria bacterium]|nr:methyltransferase domain-containing protein [Candidatus Latescibacterota bacterium]NIM21082.1 methyltransferase domain-containing protein [Candidatus Latescibacterota bacterium]NIM65217.1 methyltransferase domain-containing protein [Candidatus Latescibacterota bacterium]NIO01732.1 methyltransferase domain-containing protein [Candidatus Latescibacterota bacterium]NIO28249.1 methyltransferase domain-containing protein [Candidatus Latescibacterota bacterium]
MADFKLPDIRVPPELEPAVMPDLLRYWYLGTRARRHMALRRFREVDVEMGVHPGARILDIGSAWGFNVMALEILGYDPVGMDLIVEQFPVGQRIAQHNGVGFPVVAGDAANIPFEKERFDCVTMVETIEHIYSSDRVRALSECRRVLKQGGRIVLSTPNYYSVVERFKRFAVKKPWIRKRMPAMCYPAGDLPRAEYHPYRYHRPVPEREIRNLLEKTGFRVLKVKYFLFVLKNTSNALFPSLRTAERILENLPGLNRLAATVCFVAEK